MSKTKAVVRITSLMLAVAAIGASPALVSAWVESTIFARQASPTGCIQQTGGLVHSDRNLTIKADAVTAGWSAHNATFCNNLTTPGIFKQIGGQMTGTLLKLNSAGVGSNPDNYSICTVVGTGNKPFGAKLSLNSSFVAPCGNGWYAQVICLSNAKTRITDGVVAFDGLFNAVNPKTDCNVSPMWHPIGLGHAMPGTPVKL